MAKWLKAHHALNDTINYFVRQRETAIHCKWWRRIWIAPFVYLCQQLTVESSVNKFVLFVCFSSISIHRDRIEEFIDENKALMRRMYGDFRSTQFREPPISARRKRDAKYDVNLPGIPDITAPFNQKLNLNPDDETVTGGDSYFGQLRSKRQSKINKVNQAGSTRPNGPSANPNPSTESTTGR